MVHQATFIHPYLKHPERCQQPDDNEIEGLRSNFLEVVAAVAPPRHLASVACSQFCPLGHA